MATLTEVAYYSRKLIRFGVFFLLFMTIGRLFLDLSIKIWKKIHPPPPPPPTVSFGKIPSPPFPQKKSPEGLTFKLETPTGELPKFPTSLKVFFMPPVTPNLLALEKAKEQAALLNFKDEPQPLNDNIYQWLNKGMVISKLEMDIYAGSFKISYDWRNDQRILLEKNIPGIEQAKKEAQDFLRKIKNVEEDILTGKQKVFYLKNEGGKLVNAPSPSEANFVKVEIFRKDIENLPVFTIHPQKGVISILFSGSRDSQKRIVEVSFNYFPAKYDSFATYPIKTSSTAWAELTSNKAFIASWDEKNKEIVIRRVYLAYFDSFSPQKFLQPIVVFEGDNNFFAYLPAITPQWLQSAAN